MCLKGVKKDMTLYQEGAGWQGWPEGVKEKDNPFYPEKGSKNDPFIGGRNDPYSASVK